MPRRLLRLSLAGITIASLAVGCGETGTDSTRSSGEAASASWILTSAPADGLAVSQAKAEAKEGDRVVVRGRIGGRKHPLTDGSPVFTVMDLEIPHCGQIPGDSCGTPWDYCCETPESVTANSATVQIVDAQDQPVSQGASEGGLRPLDEVVVVGTVAPRPNADILTIRATGVYRVAE
ncbi:MAG: hypothetical protein ACTS22_02675 [Phycisphaerales bacterium]